MGGDGASELGDVGLIKNGLVVDCGGCGVQDLCVVGGLAVEDFA